MEEKLLDVTKANKNLENSVFEVIENKFKRERIKMGIFSPMGDILAPENSANLKKMLMMKADKIDIERLFEVKSDKNDTDFMTRGFKTL
jgi:hypothetical protein